MTKRVTEDSKMLVLTRKCTQTIKVDGPCEIAVLSLKGGTVKLGVVADRKTLILRGELEPNAKSRSDQGTGLAVSPA